MTEATIMAQEQIVNEGMRIGAIKCHWILQAALKKGEEDYNKTDDPAIKYIAQIEGRVIFSAMEEIRVKFGLDGKPPQDKLTMVRPGE